MLNLQRSSGNLAMTASARVKGNMLLHVAILTAGLDPVHSLVADSCFLVVQSVDPRLQ